MYQVLAKIYVRFFYYGITLSQSDNDFFCVLHKNIYHLNLVFYYLLSPFVQIVIFLSSTLDCGGAEKMLAVLLKNGRGLRECGGALYLKVWGRARDHMV